jgi:hypothetical protein
MRRPIWLGLAIAAVGSPAVADECAFAYTPAFHDTVVVPRLKTVLKDKGPDWDDPKPQITVRDQTVRLQFSNIRPGMENASVFVVRSENCGKGPVFAGLIPAGIEIQ